MADNYLEDVLPTYLRNRAPVFTRIDEHGVPSHAGAFAGDFLGCNEPLTLSATHESGILDGRRTLTSEAVCTGCGVSTLVNVRQ
jgi:hypothetical protein